MPIFNTMEYIWGTLEKKEDGAYTVLTEEDLKFLWHVGFVDTEQVPIDVWLSSFDECKAGDNAFHVTKDQFLAKDKYRYKGAIHSPFDAMRINEGKYTDDGLNELIERSIKPSIDFPPDELHRFFEEFKEKHRDIDGLIHMNKHSKADIEKLVEENPSPLRCLEMIYDDMLYKIARAQGLDLKVPHQADPKQAAAIEASVFMSTPSTQTEEMGQKLKGIEAKKKQADTVDKKKTVDLKSIRRSRKGFRG